MCKICEIGTSEMPKHCLNSCQMAKYAWNAFEEIWWLWGGFGWILFLETLLMKTIAQLSGI
jgi:hypothetical protein